MRSVFGFAPTSTIFIETLKPPLGHPSVGLDRRHAAGPRGGHRLTVEVVLHISTGEHSFDVGASRAWLDLEVPIRVAVDHPFEQLGGGDMADGYEQARGHEVG